MPEDIFWAEFRRVHSILVKAEDFWADLTPDPAVRLAILRVEMRTPLSVLRGYTEIIRRKIAAGELRDIEGRLPEWIESMHQHADKLQEVLDGCTGHLPRKDEQSELAAVDVDRLYSANDLLTLPDDGKCYELIWGKLVTRPQPGYGHIFAMAGLFSEIGPFVQAHELGQVTGPDNRFVLHTDAEGRDLVRIPHVAFISRNRPRQDTNQMYHGAPDLTVDIISPYETYGMMHSRLRQYFTYGVKAVWLVYPASRSVEVFANFEDEPRQLSGEATLDGGDLLPGLELKLSDLFRYM